uniref:Golgi integral membrane protein 4 n=1 Tax=Scophthalmus maximus TaxID=52904 RepID=A0A8D3BFK5_SCOMX
MGSGVCSRRQRRIFQCLLLLTVVCGVMYAGMVSFEMHKQLRRTEATALKYQQHQESLSAQLQVVYEHRSRLEKSLQKERLEHKKAKEDYLVYKLEAQQSLNKEKNQHDDLKKQYYDLHEQNQVQDKDHGRLLDEHRDRYEKLQQVKELEISQLKENAYNLREENKQLRKAHHDIHTQLQDVQVQHQDLKVAHDHLALTLEDHKSALAVAQVQVDEYKQLKESLNRVPNPRPPEQHAAPQEAKAAAVRAPDSHVHQDQESAIHKQEPAHENHQGMVTRESLRSLYYEDKGPYDNSKNTQIAISPLSSQVERVKSAYEQQQEQQRLEAQRSEERRQIQVRQEALRAQREKVLKEREQRLKAEQEKEVQHHRDADRREQLLREEHLRSGFESVGNLLKKTEYENMDNDIVQGEEEGHTVDEQGETGKMSKSNPGSADGLFIITA